MIPFFASSLLLVPQAPITLSVRMDQPGAKVSPSLYGIFFEEINQAGDGGIYGELLRNRGFETADGPKGLPVGWESLKDATLESADGLNEAHTRSIRIAAGGAVANVGFWGVPVEKGKKLHVTIWAKGSGSIGVGFGGYPVTIGKAKESWKRFETTIKATETATTRFVINAVDGPVSVGFASLMPEDTWKKRKNGLRSDLATAVSDMKPAFVRFPGGCYVEGGDRFSDAFDWKNSVGPVEERKGLAHSMWGYSNTFGLGYHEYLQWCEDLGAEPLFVVNCGLNHRQMTPLDRMDKWVSDALDAIEYANGPVNSKWGALRAQNGHPTPFKLKYIEIGNENGASWSYGGPAAYAPRYKVLFDAIKAKYPNIVTVADNPVPHPMEIVDEHYYSSPAFFWNNARRYDKYDRKGPKIYVGEYAVTEGAGLGNLDAALGEAAFMTGMERNSDIVTMSSYAPLFVNVNNKQWNPNAIVFDAQRSFGTPSYHVQSMFANNAPTRNVAVEYPVTSSQPPKLGGNVGLMTWETDAEFKDVRLEAEGVGFAKGPELAQYPFNPRRGAWTLKDGTFRQSSLDTNQTMVFPGVDTTGASRYTYSVKARKLNGKEGFLIVIDDRSGSQLRWNIGGWGNTETAFERNGAVTGNRVPAHIETGRWYDIRLEREGNRTRGYIDGKLVQELVETGSPDLAAVAGIDEKAKELVIKVVNGSDDARTATLDLSGRRLADTGKSIVLTGPSLNAENAFDKPNQIAPVTSPVKGISPGMTYTFAPRSLTILRIPIR